MLASLDIVSGQGLKISYIPIILNSTSSFSMKSTQMDALCKRVASKRWPCFLLNAGDIRLLLAARVHSFVQHLVDNLYKLSQGLRWGLYFLALWEFIEIERQILQESSVDLSLMSRSGCCMRIRPCRSDARLCFEISWASNDARLPQTTNWIVWSTSNRACSKSRKRPFFQKSKTCQYRMSSHQVAMQSENQHSVLLNSQRYNHHWSLSYSLRWWIPIAWLTSVMHHIMIKHVWFPGCTLSLIPKGVSKVLNVTLLLSTGILERLKIRDFCIRNMIELPKNMLILFLPSQTSYQSLIEHPFQCMSCPSSST